jgi:DNA-directed RNA polymerase subunit alpha
MEPRAMRIRWRGLELPSRVICAREKLTDTYGEFYVEPFERGFGHTVGNSLRRILLSSLEGSAVTKIKIQGVLHEFSSIPGMVEDITDLVLNIKGLVVKNHSEQNRTIRIERERRGVVTAADITHDETIEIINPDHILCTLTDDVPFVLEMTVENGRGYRPAAEGHTDDLEVGAIPIDAIYTPVDRVEYRIENTRVGQRTNYDKLTLRIWTKGTLGPEMALVEAAKILRKHLNPFVQYDEPGPGLPSDSSGLDGYRDSPVDAELDRKLGMSLAELELSVRATNCLESEGINSVRDLVSRSEGQLLTVRNFGETTLKEVKAKLLEIGLDLGMDVPQRSGV